MRSIILASALACVAGLLTTATATPTPAHRKHLQAHKRASLTPITIKGNAFWQGDKRFYVRGIDYQPGGSSGMIDPLADETSCKRDVAEFVKLGVNTIRVYMTDNSANHDACMNALADAGIYVIIDANNPLYSINRDNPKPSYNSAYLQSVFSTLDEFVKYDNTMAFFSGNEVVNDAISSTLAAPYVKALTRDMRKYLSERGYRQVPVGYSAADASSNRIQLAHYMNCGADDERSDFFAFNDYSWCNTDFQQSGWDKKVQQFTGYGIPIFLSEYGCKTNGRDFGEVQALMSNAMTGVYSGGLMYEYAMEANGFGIVNITPTGVQELPDFAKYAKALAAYPAPTGDGGYTSKSNPSTCPPKDASWLVDGTAPLPAMPQRAQFYLANGAGTGPGLKGVGSQNAVDGTDGTSTTGSAPSAAATTSSSSNATATSTSTSTSTSTPTTGTATAEPTSSNNAAGPSVRGPVDAAPFVVTGIFMAFSLVGTLLF
ncbi:Glucanosyltransferase domain containing protein [Naviculisporaceae sp. PSN 640]